MVFNPGPRSRIGVWKRRWPNGRAHGVQSLSERHVAMLNALLDMRPIPTQAEIGARFGYSRGWTSQILSSKAACEYLRLRNTERLREALKKRFAGVTGLAATSQKQPFPRQYKSGLGSRAASHESSE